MRTGYHTLAVLLALPCLTPGGVLARGFGGFGGFHGGGYGGGGFHAGGFEGGGFHGGFEGGGYGGYHAGGFEAGGFHEGGYDAGGYHAGGFDAGGYHAGGYSGWDSGRFSSGSYAAHTSGQVDSFLGLPTDGGFHAAAGGWGASMHAYQGPLGTTVVHGSAGAADAAVGPGGAAAGGRYASGTAVRGPEGNVYARGTAVGGVAGGYGTHYCSATWSRAQGLAVNRGFWNHPAFTAGWAGAHPWAWCPAGYTAAAWGAAAWNAATWPSLGSWLDLGTAPAYSYVYGQDITYQGDTVYYGSQPAGTTQQYYQEAAQLANPAQLPSDDGPWMALGVFGLVEGSASQPAAADQQPALTVQLAVNKQGLLRGNAISPQLQSPIPVQGSVDKVRQRAAWTVGDNKTTVYETGLSSLTQNESPLLVHVDQDKTQQWLLVRLQPPQDQGQQPAAPGP